MNEKNLASDFLLLSNRVEKMEDMLRKFLELQKASQDIEELESFFWRYDSENEIPNIYRRDAEDKFVWVGPEPMTRLSFFLKKNTLYRIELNIISLPPTLLPESVNITVNKKNLNINIQENNIYSSLFKSGSDDELTSINFGTPNTINPSKLGLGSDTRELSIALHSILIKKES